MPDRENQDKNRANSAKKGFPDRRKAADPDAEERKGRSTADYYKLHTKAMDDLLNADESNSPEVSKEELRKYQHHSQLRIADWVKILFIKAWFPGAVCYFFIWGTSAYISNQLDLVFIVGVAMGIVTDLLTNNILRFFEKKPGDYNEWLMVTREGVPGFILNIMYAFVVIFFVFGLYRLVNGFLSGLAGGKESMPLGVGPILFGLFYLGFDMLFIKMKHIMKMIVKDAMHKAAAEHKTTQKTDDKKN